jgi:aspartate ammonia-lyase
MMSGILEQLDAPAQAMGIPTAELADIARRGRLVHYEPGACLFHESTPRQWLGIVVDGEVRSSAVYTAAGPGWRPSPTAPSSPREFCSTSAPTRPAPTRATAGRTSTRSPLPVLDDLRSAKPEIYYRVVARLARRIGDRLRSVSERLAERAATAPEFTTFRREHDSLGEREIPNDAYYGIQTARAVENFAISGVPLRNFAHFVNALAYVKKAAARANKELACIDADKARAIERVCDEILEGKLHEQFVVDMFQGGRRHVHQHERKRGDRNRGLELLAAPRATTNTCTPTTT